MDSRRKGFTAFMAMLSSIGGHTPFSALLGKGESKKRRCRRCRSKYDPAKVELRMKRTNQRLDEKIRQTGNLIEIEALREQKQVFDFGFYCSYECSVDEESYSYNTRQQLRHAFRETAKVSIANSMGIGPKASEPRRARRKAIRSMANRLYRER